MPDVRPDPVLTVEPIVTERLLLRRFRADDLDAVHALQSDPDVVRYLPWPVRSREEAQAWLESRIAGDTLRADNDAVAYAVQRRGSDRVIGSIALFLRSVEHRQGEIGFQFERAAQGQGYAAEATAPVLDRAFRELDLHRIYGQADPRNTGSTALMRRLGMRQEAHFRENEWFKGEWGDLVVFAILRSEREARANTHPRQAGR
jgi:RimJ/RimL family protein N-acetyltransferase